MIRVVGNVQDSICIGCGLCCDGTLHGSTTVQPRDEAGVAAADLTLEENGERRFFRQPCARFNCGTCSIYARRPEVCRNYRCALLENFEAGRISKAEAREKIETAKGLREGVRAIAAEAITPAERSALANRLTIQIKQLNGAERDAIAKALLVTASLEHFLNRWFLKKKDASDNAKKPLR